MQELNQMELELVSGGEVVANGPAEPLISAEDMETALRLLRVISMIFP